MTALPYDPMTDAQKGSVVFAVDCLARALANSDVAQVRLAQVQLEALFPMHTDVEAEARFPGDAVEQLVWRTLVDRGNTPDAAAQAMQDVYDYEPFGRLVDSIERAITEEATT